MRRKTVRTVWTKAGTKISMDVYHRRAKPGKMYATTDSQPLCARCILKEWSPPAPLLYNYVMSKHELCSRCGCHIKPTAGRMAFIKNCTQSGAVRTGSISRKEHQAWARQAALEERQRQLHLRGRVEYEILGDGPDAEDEDGPDT